MYFGTLLRKREAPARSVGMRPSFASTSPKMVTSSELSNPRPELVISKFWPPVSLAHSNNASCDSSRAVTCLSLSSRDRACLTVTMFREPHTISATTWVAKSVFRISKSRQSSISFAGKSSVSLTVVTLKSRDVCTMRLLFLCRQIAAGSIDIEKSHQKACA